MTESDESARAEPRADHHADLPPDRVIETRWRWRLLLVDAVLALALAWILWDLLRGKDAPTEAEAGAPNSVEAPAASEQP